jgi:hypothetical protein
MQIKFYREDDVDITSILKNEALMEDGLRLCNDSRAFRYYWRYTCSCIPAIGEFAADWSAAIQYFKTENWWLFNDWLRQSSKYREFTQSEAEWINKGNIETLRKFGFPGV